MSDILTYTRGRLREWGACSRSASGGYPSMAAFMRQYFGTSARESEVPKEVEEVERIISRATTSHKEVLIFAYCRKWSVRRIGVQISVSKSTAHRLLEDAEWYVHAALDGVGQEVVYGANSRALPLMES